MSSQYKILAHLNDILFRLLLTLPVSTGSIECAFSTLKIIKIGLRNTNTMKDKFFLQQQLASIYVYKLSKMIFFSKFWVCLGIKRHTPGAAPEQRGWRRGGVQWRPPTRACARSGGRGRRRRGRRTSMAAALGDVGSRGGALVSFSSFILLKQSNMVSFSSLLRV